MGVRWEAATVYLALGATDMRKQINTLAAAVQERLELAPFSGALYVFCNRRRTTLKIRKRSGNRIYRRVPRGGMIVPATMVAGGNHGRGRGFTPECPGVDQVDVPAHGRHEACHAARTASAGCPHASGSGRGLRGRQGTS